MVTVRRFFPALVGLLWAAVIGAQTPEGTITGRILDNATHTPLAGVSVFIQGTGRGTVTASDGTFRLSGVPTGTQAVRTRQIGYTPQVRNIAIGTGVTALGDLLLVASPSQLDQVVVVGYSSQRKSDITGAVATVDVKNLEPRRVADVAQVLQGQVAGVQITSSTGAPGEDISIRIRGEGTIGNNSPLFVVDGVPTRDISFLNPSDMASLTVLKDAAAASIYGSRASAGVIVITTKSGQTGKPTSSINYYSGIQRVGHLPTLLNSTQYMDKMVEAWDNSGNTGVNPYTVAKTRTDLANTNWLDQLFETGKSQNIQMSSSGGTNKFRYLTSGGLYKQDGIVVFNNDTYQRMNFRTNLDAGVSNRLHVGTNLQLSYAAQDKLSSSGDAPGIIRHALIRPPVIGVYKSPTDPTYSAADPYTDLPFYATPWDNSANKFEFSANPIALAAYTSDKRDNFKTFGNLYAEYSLLKSNALKFRSNLGLDLNLDHNKAFLQNFGDDGGGGNATDGFGRQNRPTALNEDRGQETTVTWNNTLNYANTSVKHGFSALGGTEFITNYASSLGGSRQRYDFATAPFQYLNYGGTTGENTGGSASEWALFSLFSSANYSFNNRFLFTGTVRADASSRFSTNNTWGYFPSVSAGWNVSNEGFMRNVTWISDLKLRASVGKLGNQEIDNYAFLTLLNKVGDQYLISRYGNPDLKWETTTQKNLGADFGLLSNKLYLSVDYFKKNTYDILLPISLPSIVGNVSPTIVNAGDVSNKGFELALDYKNRAGGFKYSVNANMATVRNNVEKLHPNLPNITGDVYKTEVGHPLGAFYGYVMEGIYQNVAEIKTQLHGTANPSAQPGDIRFKDLNGDGVINDDDRTFIGNPIPKMSYGLNLGAENRGFDLSVLVQGVQGVDKYNDAKKITDYDSRPFNHTVAVLGAWHGEGTSNTIPRTTFNDNGSSKVSSIFVEDASYMRLKNLELGYTLGGGRGVSRGLQGLRFYVSGQNLLTKTKYTGLDPESTDPVDKGTYPPSRAFLFGTNVKF
jgi:TonB-dependent starch-binding outer membrane protein SusC